MFNFTCEKRNTESNTNYKTSLNGYTETQFAFGEGNSVVGDGDILFYPFGIHTQLREHWGNEDST